LSSATHTKPESPASGPAPRIGLFATDALRIVGLKTILGDGETCEIVPLTPPFALDTSHLALAIIDSPQDGSVFELVAACRRLRPTLGVIVLGPETDPDHIEHIIGAGAKGYLSHAASEAELKMAIGVVRDGSVWAPRKVLARLLEHTFKEPAAPAAAPVRFTRREKEVLRLLVLGHPNRQIALALGVDEGTVKAHMGRLMRKAGVDNRTALSMKAIERQWAK
jgi:DNA-binding NarL/FixJ family response regulator